MTPNPDFKDTPLSDVEYFRHDKHVATIYRLQLIESDVWPIELCHR